MNHRNTPTAVPQTSWLRPAMIALAAAATLLPAGMAWAQQEHTISFELATEGSDNAGPLSKATVVTIVNYAYLIAAVMFILGLKMLTKVKTARRGNMISSLGMLLACVATLFLVNHKATGSENYLISFAWITGALIIGAAIGLYIAKTVPMTGMPQTVALFNGFGGAASLLVAAGDYFNASNHIIGTGLPGIEIYELSTYAHSYIPLTIGLALLIGGVTFTGSLVAVAKLQGGAFNKIVPDQPVQFVGQKPIIGVLLVISLLLSVFLIADPFQAWAIWVIIAFALILGVLLVIGIGGADMPVVIALLNSYSGIAAAFAGFVLGNIALIITGALVGASGLILTQIMCKAMNRSLLNVLFGGVGGVKSGGAGGGGEIEGEARALTAEDVAIQLDAASQVMIVPGYGMAVAQAQHPVKELADLLEARGVVVRYAIHPVAGRMPGHMNVLLAEAQVPYENLLDLEAANPEFERTDVALVIGANDVTNPAARHAESSPIYGMPILNVDKARSVVVIKRSLSPGFAGIQNELYFKENCGMLFGDGKAMVNALVSELKEE